MECTVGLGESSEQLLTQLMLLNDKFINELPMVDGSSLAINGQFNFSSNHYCTQRNNSHDL